MVSGGSLLHRGHGRHREALGPAHHAGDVWHDRDDVSYELHHKPRLNKHSTFVGVSKEASLLGRMPLLPGR